MNTGYTHLEAILMIPALLLNALIVLTSGAHVKRLCASSLFIYLLCLFDLLVLTTTAFMFSHQMIHFDEPYPFNWCKINASVSVFGCLMSLILCMGLTLFRYLTIVSQRAIPASFPVRFLAVAVVLSGLIACGPFFLQSDNTAFMLRQSGVYCAFDWTVSTIEVRGVCVLAVLIATIPIVFIAYAYLAIYLEVRKVNRFAEEFLTAAGSNPLPVCSSNPDLAQQQQQPQIQPTVLPPVPQLLGAQKGSKASLANLAGDDFVNAARESTPYPPAQNASNSQGQESLARRALAHLSLRAIQAKKARTRAQEDERRLLIQSISIIAGFIIGWTPLYAVALYEMVSGQYVSAEVDFLAFAFVHVNDVVSAVVVLVFDADLRKNAYICLPCKNSK
ncbi:hypothetical protein HDU77_003422 [Chytriomyces hyalinus]|nr:hypothetical protein HDU77_003422 [Chytriomyces hyalinus]